jgi:hypothetical protein
LRNSQLNTNNASVAQLQTPRFEHGLGLLIAAGHQIAHGDPDAFDAIERYGENFDLQPGSRGNFRSL